MPFPFGHSRRPSHNSAPAPAAQPPPVVLPPTTGIPGTYGGYPGAAYPSAPMAAPMTPGGYFQTSPTGFATPHMGAGFAIPPSPYGGAPAAYPGAFGFAAPGAGMIPPSPYGGMPAAAPPTMMDPMMGLSMGMGAMSMGAMSRPKLARPKENEEHVNPWIASLDYSLLLDPLLLNLLQPKVQINPLISPAPPDADSNPAAQPHVIYNLLFPPNTATRSDDKPNRSWSAGRNQPATNPRLNVMKIISRDFPFALILKTDKPEGLTCADVIEGIYTQLSQQLDRNSWESYTTPAHKDRMGRSYHWNRSTAPGAPGGVMGDGMRQVEWLCDRVWWGGLERDDAYVLERLGNVGVCDTFVMLCFGPDDAPDDPQKVTIPSDEGRTTPTPATATAGGTLYVPAAGGSGGAGGSAASSKNASPAGVQPMIRASPRPPEAIIHPPSPVPSHTSKIIPPPLRQPVQPEPRSPPTQQGWSSLLQRGAAAPTSPTSPTGAHPSSGHRKSKESKQQHRQSYQSAGYVPAGGPNYGPVHPGPSSSRHHPGQSTHYVPASGPGGYAGPTLNTSYVAASVPLPGTPYGAPGPQSPTAHGPTSPYGHYVPASMPPGQ